MGWPPWEAASKPSDAAEPEPQQDNLNTLASIDNHDNHDNNDRDQRVKWALPILHVVVILTEKKTLEMDQEMKSAVDFLTSFLYDMKINKIACKDIAQFDISIRTCRMTLTEIRRIVYRKNYRDKHPNNPNS